MLMNIHILLHFQIPPLLFFLRQCINVTIQVLFTVPWRPKIEAKMLEDPTINVTTLWFTADAK